MLVGPMTTRTLRPAASAAGTPSRCTRRLMPMVAPEPEKITACSSPAPQQRPTTARASRRRRVMKPPQNEASVCELA